jgi:LDH2 family malate/lactate/ureidoglycolate dehydrogenase
MKISIIELRELVFKKLNKIYDEEDAKRITDVIVTAELSQKYSHGIVRLLSKHFNIKDKERSGKPVIKNIAQNIESVDGKFNSGMLVLSIATDEAIKLGKQNSMAIVGTYDSLWSSGYISYYLRKIVDNGLIGIIMARSTSSVTGFGSRNPLFGTNPIGFAFPGKDGNNFILDISTAIISYGGLMKAESSGVKLLEGIAFTKEGKATTDPKEAMEGTVLTFDKGYKSAGLAMVVEILSGIFVGAGYGTGKGSESWGNVVITIKPDLFISMDEFKAKLSDYLSFIKLNINNERLPGEESAQIYKKNLESGFIEVDENIVNQIKV